MASSEIVFSPDDALTADLDFGDRYRDYRREPDPASEQSMNEEFS
jgi:hypothetical protein